MAEIEYIPPDLKTNIFYFRITGMWAPLKRSYLYHLLSIFILVVIGIGCPLTQIINVIFVDSLANFMDQLLVSVTVVAATVKGVNFYMQQKKVRRIFALHKRMLDRIDIGFNDSDDIKLQKIIRFNVLICKFFLYIYWCGLTAVGFQTIFSSPEKRLWPSTYFLPFESAKVPTVYMAGLIYQGFSEFWFCIWNAIEDTYPIIMVLMLCNHMEKLQNRLCRLGTIKLSRSIGNKNKRDSNKEFYVMLKDCSIYYEDCLRFDERYLIENIFFNSLHRLRFI